MEIIITGGFLGSGKTTFLLQLTEYLKAHNKKVAVLMNEYGKMSVDTHIVDQDVPLKELLNGCICCDLKMDVEIQIHQLYLEHQPDVIIIEASGVAHPVEIMDACLSPVLAPFTKIGAVFSILDASVYELKDNLSPQIMQLLMEQIKYASVLIVNKCDALKQMNRETLLNELVDKTNAPEIVMTEFAKIDNFDDFLRIPVSLEYKTSETSARKHSGIQSYTYQFNHSIEAQLFVDWLKNIPENIFRVKGFLSFMDAPERLFLFQYAYGVPEYKEIIMKLPQYIVVIGESLNKESLESIFIKCENHI